MNIIDTLLCISQTKEQLSESVSIVKKNDLDIILVKHQKCSAALSLQGAHLLFWHPTKTSTPVIWLSEETQLTSGIAIRGGVPVCWPWFSNLGGAPSHGFARINLWTLVEHTENEQEVTLKLEFNDTEQTRKIWNNPFKLTLNVVLGEKCSIELHSEGSYEATAALHTYFQVKDINTTSVSGLGKPYIEKLSTTNIPTIIGEQLFDQEVDRIYTQPETISYIRDSERTLKVTHKNATDIVVWNPWTAKSQSMQDMADDGYKTMVCVETSRINKPLKATPNKGDTLGFTVEVE